MKKERKKGLTSFAVIIIGLLIFSIYHIQSALKANTIDSEYYKKTNLKFSGIITKVNPLSRYGHDYGVISVDIFDANKEHYDPRDSLERFLGVLKNNKVNLVFNIMSDVQITDSIAFNIQKIKIYRNGNLIRESIVGMPPDDIFNAFNEVHKKIEL